jgi:hypothetical protein
LLWACGSFGSDGKSAAPADAGIGDVTSNETPSCAAIVLDLARISFGEVRVGLDGGPSGTSEYTVPVRNAGVLTRTFRAAATAPFTVAEPGPQGLAPGESRPVRGTFAPSAVGPASGKLTITTDDGCSAATDLEGSGTDSPYAVSPAKVDFGSVLCNQPVAARSIVIDSAPGPVGNWQATVASPFAVPPSGALVPGGKVSVDVGLSTPFTAPTPVTERPLSLTLPDGKARQISVSASGRGAVINFEAPVPTTGGLSLHIVNSGNDVANLVVVENGSLGLSFMPPTVSISPATTATVLVRQGAYGSTTVTVKQDPARPGAVCSTASLPMTFDDPTSSSSSTAGGN